MADLFEVNAAYQRAQELLGNLHRANFSKPSEARDEAIFQLNTDCQIIEDVDFPKKFPPKSKDDFTFLEHDILAEAASNIRHTDAALEDAHEIVLMEVEVDLAEASQFLALGRHESYLKYAWTRRQSRRSNPLKEMPPEILDEYTVIMFERIQAILNRTAENLEIVKTFRCLNRDDYSSLRFDIGMFVSAVATADFAIDSYENRVRLRNTAAALAEEQDDGPSIGGRIWALIGWDSPTDFLKDMVITVATGGASKVVRWGSRILKGKQRLKAVNKGLDLMLDIEKSLGRMEGRIAEIRKTAGKIRTLHKWAGLPREIIREFKRVDRLKAAVDSLTQDGIQELKGFTRGVASTIASNAALSKEIMLPGALSSEAARRSVMSMMRGLSLSKKIEELEPQIKWRSVFRGDLNNDQMDKFMNYFWLVFKRELIVRWSIMTVQKLSISVDRFVQVSITSFFAAIEETVYGLGILSRDEVKAIVQTLLSSIRKAVEKLFQGLAAKALS